MITPRAVRTTHAKAAIIALLPVPVFLMAACTQAPADNTAELQAKLTAAEARADAAEKRAKSAEAAAGQHYQETIAANAPAQAENGQPEGQFGQPVIDTAPIDTAPAPAAPPQLAPGAMTN